MQTTVPGASPVSQILAATQPDWFCQALIGPLTCTNANSIAFRS